MDGVNQTDPSSITVGSLSLTKIITVPCSNVLSQSLWGGVNPPTGTPTITYTGIAGYPTSRARLITGFNQSFPYYGANSSAAENTTPGLALSSNPNDLCVDELGWGWQTAAASPTGTNQVADDGVPTSGSTYHEYGSYEPGSASVTMSWNLSATAYWCQVAVSIRRAALGSQIIILQYKKLMDDIKRGLLAPRELMRGYRQMNQKLGLMPI